MLRATPQLSSALPRQRLDCVELDVHTSSLRSSTHPHAQWRMYVGHLHAHRAHAHLGRCSGDVNTSPDTWAAVGLELATTARRTPTRDSANRNPCRQAAFSLPFASQPPDVGILRSSRPRRHYGPNSRRAFVITRSGFDTMARRRQETEDEITETPLALQHSAVLPPVEVTESSTNKQHHLSPDTPAASGA